MHTADSLYFRPPEGMFSCCFFFFLKFGWGFLLSVSLGTVITSIYHIIMFLSRLFFLIADDVLLFLPFARCLHISSSLLIYRAFFPRYKYYFFFFLWIVSTLCFCPVEIFLHICKLLSLMLLLIPCVFVSWACTCQLHFCSPLCSHPISPSLLSIPLLYCSRCHLW